MLHRFANPARFLRFSNAALPVCSMLSVLLLTWGIYVALAASPDDYQQGELVRIMYVHVPAAWMAVAIYAGMALCSAAYLVWKHPLADIAARASAFIGAAFTLLTLITGSLWAKPAWGAWWVWDARLTSVLVLFFLYVGYMVFEKQAGQSERGSIYLAVLALIGAFNLPIIKFSVDWWHTLHQPASLLRIEGPAIDPSMLHPLLVMMGAAFFLYLSMLMVRMRTLLLRHKIQRLQNQPI